MPWWEDGSTQAAVKRGAQETAAGPAKVARLSSGEGPRVGGFVNAFEEADAGFDAEVLVMSTSANDMNEPVVRTLVGEYVELSANHGRKVYEKIQANRGPAAVDILLYYWDDRDGATYEGWWFGDKVGGSQVWCHCRGGSLSPPEQGWRVPWDGEVRPTLTLEPQAVVKKRLEVARRAKQQQEEEARFSALEENVNGIQRRSAVAVQEAVALATGEQSTVAQLAKAGRKLYELDIELERLDPTFRMTWNPSYATRVADMAGLCEKSRTLLKSHVTKLKRTAQRVARRQGEHEVEAKDRERLQSMLPEIIKKLETAEELVQQAGDTAVTVSEYGQMDEMMLQALRDTETVAKQADRMIADTRLFINMRVATTHSFSPAVKEQAKKEFEELQTRLAKAKETLAPLKCARGTWEKERDAKSFLSDIAPQVEWAEVELAQIETKFGDNPLEAGASSTMKEMKVVESKLLKLQATLEPKVPSMSGGVLASLNELLKRCADAKTKLHDLRQTWKDAENQASAKAFMMDCNAKVEAALDAVAEVEAEDAKFPPEAAHSVVAATQALISVETAAAKANRAVSSAKTYIETKLLEAKRMATKDAIAKLLEAQKQLGYATGRLAELQAEGANRKHMALMSELGREVAEAEEHTASYLAVSAIFDDDERLCALPPEEVLTLAEQARVAEQVASMSLQEARRSVASKQAGSRRALGADKAADFDELLDRVTKAHSDVTTRRRVVSSADLRRKLGKATGEAEEKMQGAEDRLTVAIEVVDAAPDVPLSGDLDFDYESASLIVLTDAAEANVKEAQLSLNNATRYVESHIRNPSTVQKLQEHAASIQKKLNEQMVKVRQKREKLDIRTILQELHDQFDDFEATVKLMQACEKQVQNNPLPDAAAKAAAAASLESAVQASQRSFTGIQTLLSLRSLSLKRLSEAGQRLAKQPIALIRGKVNAVGKEVTDARARSIDLKRQLLRRH